jgi:hypothetical protein
MGTTEKTYEMLWDCRYCGQKKLLGLTHRFCANCGAPQDAAARYFPSDAEKVAVQDHQYVGADLQCPACATWNSRNANCCTHCGGPLSPAAKAARVRAEQVQREGQAFVGETLQHTRQEFGQPGAPPQQPPPKKKKTGVRVLVAALVVLALGAIGFICTCVFWTKEGAFEVAGHGWERTVEIEVFSAVRKSAWCDNVPVGARELGRYREQRSTKKIPNGEECQTRRKDQGDGTFKEIRECKPKYREEAVMDYRCDYEANEWSKKGEARATGASLKETPAWPNVTLGRTGTCLGCEREGRRTESYVVRFVDPKTKQEQKCTFDEAKWSSFALGSRWAGEIGVIHGGLDCGSLKAQ